MDQPVKHTGLRRIVNSFIFSYNGLRACWRTEEAFRQEVVGGFLLFIPLGLYVGETPVEKVILAGTVLLLLIVELLNTAIERAIDRISFDRHDLSKEAKDMGSAAVLLTLILALLSWGLILFG